MIKSLLRSDIFKKIFKFATIYTGTNFLSQALPFFLLPILTRYLSPSDYGILATFIAAVSIANIVVSMGCDGAVVRYYFDKKKDDFDFPRLVFNAIFVNLIVFLLFTLLFVFFKNYIGEKLHILPAWLLLIPFLGFCRNIYRLPASFYLVDQKPIKYSVFTVSTIFFELILTIFLVVAIGLNWQGRVLGITINSLIFLMIGLFLLKKDGLIKFSVNFRYIKNLLSFGVPVIFHSLGFVVVGAIDRFFINSMVGLSETGLYSVGYSVSMIIGFLVGAFNMAWVPIFYEKLNRATDILKIKLVKLTYLYFIGISFLSFALIFIGPYFLKVFVGKEFLGSYQFIYWLALGYAVHGMYVMVVNYIFYEKKTYILSIIAVITVVLNIIFNYVLIKLNGAIGAAQATFLTFLLRFLLVWFFSNKVYPMPWLSFLKPAKV